jgi:ubiquinone/menaquinone biosynthesis C-methylase UbiE
MNHFAPKHIAERYAKGRPFFHRETMARIKSFLGMNNKLKRLLDVACGTGLSTEALLDIAYQVYGTDASAEMIGLARHPEKIKYAVSFAEQQPFPDNTFDLITVCSGVHWFDIDAFLQEAARILLSQGWLILYDNFFLSEMKNGPDFHTWFPEVYLPRFPAPKRNNIYNWSNENLQGKHFVLHNEEEFKNEVLFSKEELILYFTTQSNISAAIETGAYTYAEIEAWLDHELSPFFLEQEPKRVLYYGNKIQYLQKLN